MNAHHLSLDLRSYKEEVQAHQHDYHQLVFSVDGSLDIDVGGLEGRVSEHTASVIHAGQNHHFSADKKNQFLVADISGSLATELVSVPRFISIDDALTHYIRFLRQTLIQGCSSINSERQMLILLIHMLRERYGIQMAEDKRIEAARVHIDRYFSEPISLKQLACVASLSIRQLSELFRQQVGMTPQQYLIDKRMQEARHLLNTECLTVQQIADKVGYQNLSAFSDRFRQHFGQSPRQVRQKDK